mmetsp:Transcript_16333/g.27327  ORF Transcript_16333/g.27327 Transcript_16333/m.27327 type:complete len:403 (+) Transcript_16333:84-1292(+)
MLEPDTDTEIAEPNRLCLPQEDVANLKNVRRHLHQNPELSSEEWVTAKYVADYVHMHSMPTEIYTTIGGTGVIVVYDSMVEGPAVLFRAELDALPIYEINDFSHKSNVKGVSHKCGHDGHCTTLLGLSVVLKQKPLKRGKVYLLFQPAEETGEGAERVLRDEVYQEKIKPDFVFAFHNIPGYRLGQIILRKGAFTASVRSLKICIHGKPSHAAEPENGVNPSLTVANILLQLDKISNNILASDTFRVITPVHVKVGEVAYGVSAGYGELHLTIRAWTEAEMAVLVKEILEIVNTNTTASRTTYTVSWTDVFQANENTDDAVDVLECSAIANEYIVHHSPHPMKWGEDFGVFTQCNAGAFFGIGAGERHAALHNDDYDYPDEILIVGLNMLTGVLTQFDMFNS